jgi:hypothetical protein
MPTKPDVPDEPEYVPDYERPTMPFERKATIDASVGRWGAIGFEFGLFVAVFFLGGLWLDGKFGTRPWAAAIGALVGVGMGMYMLIRRVSSLSSPPAGKDADPTQDDAED